MAKRRAPTSRQGQGDENPRQEARTKRRHESGSSSQHVVNPSLASLFRNQDRANVFKEKFNDRHVMAYKHVNFPKLIKMHDTQNIDTANYIAVQGWQEFIQVNRPVYRTLLKILMSNLDENSMTSWIGGTPVDLSMDAWCRTFQLPPVSVEDESSIMTIEKEELFFRLTGVRNLGVQPFIRINQLHQEANVRLTAQIVMNVLIPKKGSKEQIKLEEGRLLYALIYGKQINLARMIVERLRAALRRKSVPICYGMHLTVLMEQAGVDVSSAGDKEEQLSSAIDHHTLKRLGYKLDFHDWVYVGRGRVNTEQAPDRPSEQDEEAEAEQDTTAQAASAAPSQPPPLRPRSTRFVSQLSSDIAHLRQLMMEQFQYMQATIMSKLESMDSRLQACETHLGHKSRASSPPPPSSDPKGKAPMVSPRTSPAPSPTTSPIPSPEFHIPLQTDPVLVHSHSSHSAHSSDSSSSESTPQEFELSARTPPVTPHISTPTPSHDSEATASDPSRFLATPPPSPHAQPPSPAPPPAPPVAPTRPTRTKLPSIKNPTPPSALTPYTRRKLAVSRPSTSPPPPPPPPQP